MTDIEKPGSSAKKFHCPVCTKSFTTALWVEQHILKKHVGDKDYKCMKCLETKQIVKFFATHEILTEHIKRSHGPPRYKCQVCFKTFTDSSNFTRHKRSHSQNQTNKKQKCSLCSKELLSKYLRSHMFYAHKQKYKGVKYLQCELCSQEFDNRFKLESHIVDKHVVDKEFPCPVCSKKFIDQNAVEKHIRVLHEKRIKHFCDVCSEEFAYLKDLVYHVKLKHEISFHCHKCSKFFKGKSEFDQHLSGTEISSILKCQICTGQRSFDSPCLLNIHTNSWHSNSNMGIKTRNETASIQQQLSRTKNQFNEKAENKEPKLKVSKTQQQVVKSEFKCDVCSKTFDREAYCKSHRRLVHPNAGWKCIFEGCSKTFKKHYLRATHIANNHQGQRPFKCPVSQCKATWNSTSALDLHVLSHDRGSIKLSDGKKERPFKCEICTTFRAFKTLYILKRHHRRVHSLYKADRPSDSVVYLCSSDECSFETVKHEKVAIHYNEQHGLPKVVLLKNCSSPSRGLLVRANEKTRKCETSRLILKRYKCQVCSKYIKLASSFGHHRDAHLNKARFQCSHCPKSFTHERTLYHHIQEMHSTAKKTDTDN